MTRNEKIGENMTRYPYIANRKMTVKDAFSFMKECDIRHLPVIQDGRIVGVVSDRDLRQAMAFTGPGEILVEDVMVNNPYRVKMGTPLAKVAQVMAENRYGCTLIENEKGHVVGIFTTTDGMRLLANLLNKADESGAKVYEIDYETFPEYLSV